MPSPILRLTAAQFADLARTAPQTVARRINAVHLHHTWRPRRSDFRGLATVEAMRRYHMGLGWSDIAQHLTIDPQGGLWTGRNWNAPPASQTGKNGSAAQGPFMIEMVGDFDSGADVLEAPQLDAAVDAVCQVLAAYGLGSAALFFHNELGSSKTCPGSGVVKKDIVQRIDKALVRLAKAGAPAARGAKARAARSPIAAARMAGFDVLLPVEGPAENRSVPENMAAANAVDAWSRALSAAGGDRVTTGSVAREADEWAVLRPHVINLTKGRLSQSGSFIMKPGALEGIIDAVRDYAASHDEPRVMLHAHGGLVGERSALEYARGALSWWLDQGIYPVYFVWETSAFDVLRQALGRRAILGDARDRIFEALARRAGGKWAWGEMKESALRSSSADTGDGHPGGAFLFAQLLAAAVASKPAGRTIEINAVGHSAGAIFHAHLLPLLLARQVPIDSLSLLAPAVRNDLFIQALLPAVKARTIRRLAMFTMNEEAERDDDLVEFLGATVYGKSLLYLISRAFEAKRKTPLLGLEQTLRDDPTLWPLFNGGGARLELSTAKGETPNPNTTSRSHGCFDNDPPTMKSVATVVTNGGPPAVQPFPNDGTCQQVEDRRRAFALAPGAFAAGAVGTGTAGLAGRGSAPAGRRTALCIGIDAYPSSPLSGCVHDAEAWGAELRRHQFSVSTLVNARATREQIIQALSAMVESAAPGDVLVFQYSGHGTQVADLNGDETDGFDESFVPVDYETGALLLDDDLGAIYARLPEGALLTLFMDCCHAGTNSRFRPLDRGALSPGVRRRFLPMTPRLEDAHRAFRSRLGGRAASQPNDASLPGVVHFAACLDHEFAYEMNGSGNFTRTALPLLRTALSGRETNESYLARVGIAVAALGHPQTPRLMRLTPALAGRPVLASLGGASVEASPTPDGVDRDLLYHLQAAVRLVQGQG